MKRFVQVMTTLLLSITIIGTAEAVFINGNISFGGGLKSTNDLSITNVIDFDPQTAIVSTTVSGDFTAAGIIPFVTTATFQDFQFNPFVPNNPVWTTTGFSFSLTSLVVDEQDDDSIVLLGSGEMSKVGFDPTPFLWSFSANRTLETVAFAATNSAVPEPGTLLLVGSGLLGLAWLRRKQQS